MSTIIDLNTATTVNFNNQADYAISFGTNLGNTTATIDAFGSGNIAGQTPLNSITSPVRDLLIDVQFSNVGAVTMSYAGAFANIGILQTAPAAWRVNGIRSVTQYNEAFANVRYFDLTGSGNTSPEYSYITTVNDQSGNTRSWNTTVDVRSPPVLSNTGAVLFRQNTSVDITQLSITGNTSATSTYVLTTSVSPALGQVSNTTTTSSNVSITGNIAAISAAISANSLQFIPAAGLTSNVTSALNFKLNLNNNLASQANANITYVPTVYTTNTVSQIFSSVVPKIHDGADTGQTYTVTFTSPGGKFGNSVAYFNANTYANLASTYTFTGNMSTVNANFANVRFAPLNRDSGNTSYTYTQSRGNVVQIDSLRDLTANVVPFVSNVSTFTANTTFSPTFVQAHYGNTNVLMVGGGGSGGFPATSAGPGGGGAGGVATVITVPMISGSTYNLVIGAGGGNGVSPGNGGNTRMLLNGNLIIGVIPGVGQANTIVNGGGQGLGGAGPFGLEYFGGSGGSNDYHTGGAGIASLSNGGIVGHSGGGAGASGQGGPATTTPTRKGGDGGAGFLSNITGANVRYAGGGAGRYGATSGLGSNNYGGGGEDTNPGLAGVIIISIT